MEPLCVGVTILATVRKVDLRGQDWRKGEISAAIMMKPESGMECGQIQDVFSRSVPKSM